MPCANNMLWRAFVLAIAIGVATAGPSQEETDNLVTELTSKNFEHLTQAATGATTGTWLVYFDLTNIPAITQSFTDAAPTLINDHNIVLGHVNCAANDDERYFCAKRFHALTHVKFGAQDRISLFHQGKEYAWSLYFHKSM